MYLCWELQRLYKSVSSGHDENIIVEVQPQIGKSTMCSELFPAWVLGKSAIDHGEGWPIICASYGASLAEQKSQNCRDIVDSEIFQMIFPGTRLHPDTQAKEFWKTTSGGSYRAVGVGGGLTGMPGKLLIADDLFKDRAEADSEVTRESTWKWWSSVFMSRKQSKSGVCLVNTRWHLDDVAGRLEGQFEVDKASGKKEWEYDQWRQLTFPAFAEEDEYLPDPSGEMVLFRRAGEVLCPERFTYEDMVKRRNSTEIYEWSALYMQQPILSANADFKKEWFRFFEDKDVKDKQLQTTTTLDLAISQKASADSTVICTVGKERATGYWYVLEVTAGRLDPLQTIDAMFLHFSKWRSRFWIESVAYQAALQYFVVEEQRKRHEYFEVNELTQKQTRSKEARIRGLIPLFKAGVIFIRPGQAELMRELLQFPKGKHDDHPDALSMQLDVVENTQVVMTPEEKAIMKAEETAGFDPHSAFNRI